MSKEVDVKHHVFSFFSGIGLLDLGFEHAGFEVAFVNENNPQFMKSYQHARARLGVAPPEHGYSQDSIEDFLEAPKKKFLTKAMQQSRASGCKIGFIGGPPCPDFSVGGKNRGRHGDNGRLSQVYVDMIVEQKPDWFLFENVKGLWRTARHREFFDELCGKLKNAGYELSHRLFNSIECGVAQDRDRIILFGILKRRNKVDWESGLPFPNAKVLRDIDWVDRTPFGSKLSISKNVPAELTVQYWFRKNAVESHPNSSLCFKPRAGLARFKTVDEGDDSRKSFKRLHRYRYSPTAAYGNNEVHLHPTEPRRISAAEALAIQSAPKDFELHPEITLSAAFKTVGNAVPYLLANHIAKAVKKAIEAP